MTPRRILVLGGARSGKSRYAQELCQQFDGQKIYLATGEAGDHEMAARIARHQKDRGPEWLTIEAPVEIASVLLTPAYASAMILVDCLTLWLSNLLEQKRDIDMESQRLRLAIAQTKSRLVLVSNEVGQGIVPDNALARNFRDQAGILHQQVAHACDRVVFVTAGLPMVLK